MNMQRPVAARYIGRIWLAKVALGTLLSMPLGLPAIGGDLFEPVAATAAAPMSADQQSLLDRIRSRPTTAAVQVVRINFGALRDATTTLALPNAPAVTATQRSVERRGDQDFTWHGTISDAPGNAIFVVRNGNVTGNIHSGTSLYHVSPLGNGLHAVVKVDQSRMPPDHPPSFREIERRSHAAPPVSTQPQRLDVPIGALTTIDVLTGHTSSAAAQVADIEALIQLAVDEANQSFRNSQVNLQIRLVDTLQVTYNEAGRSYDTILAHLAGTADGFMDEIHQRRNESGADLVTLIVNQGDFCGMADAILATEATAFAAVHFDCAAGNFSFAHEIGHLMGA